MLLATSLDVGAEMTQLYVELSEELSRRRYGEVARTLQRIANQPGLHGARALCGPHRICGESLI
jgi:hypothetical protein